MKTKREPKRTHQKETPSLSENLTWVYPQTNPAWIEKLIKDFKIHPTTAQVLLSRGILTQEQIHSYFYAQLPELHDPYLMKDMDKAVKRILKALKQQESILIYGDNDVDGMTGTALLMEFFETIGIQACFLIPSNPLSDPSSTQANHSQFDPHVLDEIKKYDCSLMITVDCGITASKEIEDLVNAGIDVIVTDHHEPTDQIPNCIATLNPKRVHSTYPNRELTGVGVAFKLAHALTSALMGKVKETSIDLKNYLDLVAMGTIADMGALLGENRILVRYGLKQLQSTKRLGLQQLACLCDVDTSELSAADIASKIAPRLNSLGRIANPAKGVELLITQDADLATILSHELELNNIERQKIERIVYQDIEKHLEENPSILAEKALVLSSSQWHPGVIALISTRLSKKYNRPTAVISVQKGIAKGSLRTISAFPLLPALKNQEETLLNFGGHNFAAGMMIKPSKVETFKKQFIQFANSTLKEQDVLAKLHLDAETNFDELSFELMESLELMQPFGNENPPPVLYCQAKQSWLPKIVGKVHLKMYFEQGDRLLEGFAFNMAHRKHELKKKNQRLLIAYTPQVSSFQNKTCIQLLIRDFQLLS